MKSRCLNPNTIGYARYGGRGITVCERWLSFENFLADMGEPPPGFTIDRYPDNDGNYEPANCRWATSKEQSRNKVSTKFVTFRDETMSLAEAIERFGRRGKATISARLRRGWDLERALLT